MLMPLLFRQGAVKQRREEHGGMNVTYTYRRDYRQLGSSWGLFLLPMVGTCTVRMCELPQYSIKIEMVGFNVGLDALKHLDDFP